MSQTIADPVQSTEAPNVPMIRHLRHSIYDVGRVRKQLREKLHSVLDSQDPEVDENLKRAFDPNAPTLTPDEFREKYKRHLAD